MNKWVYNISLLVGGLLHLVGASLWNLPAGLATTGLLIIFLTLAGARSANTVRGG